MKVYRCLNCEEIIITRNDNSTLKCCNNDMIEVIPNQENDEMDLHIPYIRKVGNLVTVYVGRELHPMLDVHFIDFIVLETDKGIYYKKLALNDPPIADFLVHNEENILMAYAYCNCHFLFSSCDIENGIDLLAKSTSE